MKKSIRHLAADILTQVNQSGVFASSLLDEILEQQHLSQTADGKLLTFLVYGVLRNRGYLDWIIAKLYHAHFEQLEEIIKNILRVALFQLAFSERLPSFAVVNEAVKHAKRIRRDKTALVNAILRNYLRRRHLVSFPSPHDDPAQYLSIVHSHPRWLVDEWINIFGAEETMSLCASNNKLPPMTARVNTLKISRENLINRLAQEGFSPAPTSFSPDGIILDQGDKPPQKTAAFSEGFFRLQDEGAQLISLLAAPQPGELVLDACAGSGGKTTHLAMLMNNNGRIIAADKNISSLQALNQEVRRLGIEIIETHPMDLNLGLPVEFQSSFDLVLVDAPCSGTGTLRRNPEIKWRLQPADVEKSTVLQEKILHRASQAVKKGGRLIYCTCSLLSAENENIVERFLSAYREFCFGSPPSFLPKSLFDRGLFLRTYPHVHGTDGFFAAILERR